ncbi:MAG: hypothetical protein KGH71_01025 [Candidatus Micrarchaeota archaeon]|nr:hypothetical protein [Candidatus Micrarchaeota archaeon]
MDKNAQHASDEIKRVYHLVLELHNKVADCLNHLAVEKESLEDMVDALNRVKKMSAEMELSLSHLKMQSGGDEASLSQLRQFRQSEQKLELLLADYSARNKLVFSYAGEFAQSWNQIEEQLGLLIEKLKSNPENPPPYIR